MHCVRSKGFKFSLGTGVNCFLVALSFEPLFSNVDREFACIVSDFCIIVPHLFTKSIVQNLYENEQTDRMPTGGYLSIRGHSCVNSL